MTLKEKFTEEIFNSSYQILHPSKFVKIADEFAIEFAHWCEWQDGKAFKTFEELLEIFKKEKGL